MQTTQSTRANTWEVFKGLMELKMARGSELEDRATEAMKPINRKKNIVTNKSRGPMGQWQMSGIHEEEVMTMAHKQEEERVDGTKFNKGHKLRFQKHSKAPKKYKLGSKETWTPQNKITKT